MLRYSFDLAKEADLLDQAAKNVVAAGFRTGDIMSPGATLVSTTRMGDEILKELDRLGA
jgi:3-isopropylmalate dehydrogenase